MYSKRFLLSLILVSTIGFVSYAFGGSAELKFNTGHVNVHLNCTPYPTVNVIVSGTQYQGYSAYLPWLSNVKFTNVTINDVPSGIFPNGRGAVSNDTVSCVGVDCMKFAAATNGTLIDGSYIGGTFTVENSGFFRNRVIEFTGGSVTAVLSRVDTGAGGLYYSVYNSLLVLSALTVSGDLGPCGVDNDAPTFGFTGMISGSHITNYTLPQFNDRVYRFDLRDMSGDINDRGFSSGYYDDWSPDWDNGTYYDQTVTNGSGIDLSTFVMEVAVENTPDSAGAFSKVTLTGTLNFTGGASIAGSTAGLVFYPYGFTWNRWNRNYTGSATTGILSANTARDASDNRQLFGDQPEEEVVMTGYVYDRAMIKSNVFAIHFNYGAIPRSANHAGSGLVQYCGPNGVQTIGVTAPTADSGAYIEKHNSYFVLKPFKVYLHDDWAGIDTGTITVYLSGTQGGSRTGITLTVNSSEITINEFSWVGPINVVTAGNGSQNVYSVPDSTRNYETTINYAGQWDPETKIDVKIDYKDKVGRTGTQIKCDYYNTYAPYVNNRTTDVHLKRTPFSSGAVLSGLIIKVEDEWAGVNSGTIVLTISGRTINDIGNRTTAPVNLVFSGASLFSWLTPYTTHSSALAINGGQVYNYTITIPENANYAGYFAPEHPFDISITYTDFAGHVQTTTKQFTNLDDGGSYTVLYGSNVLTHPYTNTNSFLVDINENPLLRGFSAAGTIDWLAAFPLSTYSATSGNTQFTGMKFSIMDHRAGVDGDYNLVIVTGYRRGNIAKYVFATPTSTLSEPCTGNCITGAMTSEGMLVPDYDTYNTTHPTVQRSTGYQYQITGHQIYFDYGIVGNSLAYNVNVSLSDLRPDDPNNFVTGTSLQLPTLACTYLSRCSHDQLTFVWGSGVTDMTKTIDMNPLTGTIDGNIVDIFGGTRVSVIGSGVTIDTGTSILYCSAAGGALDTPITLNFANANPLPDTPTSTGYTEITLKVADGLFELSGNTLIVK